MLGKNNFFGIKVWKGEVGIDVVIYEVINGKCVWMV